MVAGSRPAKVKRKRAAPSSSARARSLADSCQLHDLTFIQKPVQQCACNDFVIPASIATAPLSGAVACPFATAFCDATRSCAFVLLLGLVSKPNPLAGNAATLSLVPSPTAFRNIRTPFSPSAGLKSPPAPRKYHQQRARETPGTYNKIHGTLQVSHFFQLFIGGVYNCMK